jgi:uncharacterized protein (DUF433 family)
MLMTEFVHDPEHSDGAPTIGDTGIRVINVASANVHSGYTPEQLLELYPTLSLEDVHTALAYYYGNREAFEDPDTGSGPVA